MRKTIKSVRPPCIDTLDQTQVDNSVMRLNHIELSQLGKGGLPSREVWCQIREFMVERSITANPKVTREYLAYTPAETLELMNTGEIKQWLDNIQMLTVPREAKVVAFVPCAKTKPWSGAKRGIYKSYNRIIEEFGSEVYFVTISEPLGVVPQSHWSSFPQYDNSGLFRDVVQRSGGLFTRDWVDLFGKKYKLPWDEDAYEEAILKLSAAIKLFYEKNKRSTLQFISFVNDPNGIGTHEDMLTKSGIITKERMYAKRGKPRQEPYHYIRDILINNYKLEECSG